MEKLLTLEPSKIVKVEKKRNAQDPDISVLTPEQRKAFDEIVEFYHNDSPMWLLEGFAGTGKTFLISRFLEYAISCNSGIVVTAPTNKAVKVLRKTVDFVSNRLAFFTTHSLLGLKEQVDGYGKIKFVADKTSPNKIDEYDFVIVDEVSMLDDSLFTELYHHTQRGCKLLFVGDSKQIPPINQPVSTPFNEKRRATLSIGQSLLKDIVRQKAGNPIIELTMLIRERPLCRDLFGSLIETNITDESTGVMVLTARDTEYLNDVIQTYFTSDNFKQDSDFIKMVAWRNVTVNYLNNEVRNMLFGSDKRKIEVGEKMLANTPILEEGRIIFTTNDEFEVVSFTIEEKVIDSFLYKYYKVFVSYITDTGAVNEAVIKVLHEDAQPGFDEYVGTLKKLALESQQGTFEARMRWERYYQVLRLFADTKYNYAITAHKSQGSTYENCIVFEADINANPNIVERNKIKYTACSRAAKLLFLVN